MGDENGRSDFRIKASRYRVEIVPKHPETTEWIDWPDDRVLTEVRLIPDAEHAGDGQARSRFELIDFPD